MQIWAMSMLQPVVWKFDVKFLFIQIYPEDGPKSIFLI